MPTPSPQHPFWHPSRAVGRIFISGSVGVLTGAMLSLRFSLAIAVLGGWNGAAADDPGRTAVYVLVLLASIGGLLAASVLARRPPNVSANETDLLLAFCLVTVTVITSRQIRSSVLFHAALSFFYNTAILAFVLNLVFGHAA